MNFDLQFAENIPNQEMDINAQQVVDISGIATNSGGDISYEVVGTTNYVDISFDGTDMIIDSGDQKGIENVQIKAVSGDEYVNFWFQVILSNPAEVPLYLQDFEGVFPPAEWTLQTSGAGWKKSNAGDGYNSNYCAYHHDDQGDQDSWIISKPIEISSDLESVTLSYMQKDYYASYYHKHTVAISTDMTNWTTLDEGVAADSWEVKEFDLMPYSGQTVYVGFHYEGNYADRWFVDDFLVYHIDSDNIDENIAKDFSLSQNYPNPFNPTTSINFSIDNSSEVSLTVFNANGELVNTVVNGMFEGGSHSINFDGSDLNSGVYFYKLSVNGVTDTKKMILVK